MDVTPHRASDHPPAAGETSTGGPTYVLSRWLFLRLLVVVEFISRRGLSLVLDDGLGALRGGCDPGVVRFLGCNLRHISLVFRSLPYRYRDELSLNSFFSLSFPRSPHPPSPIKKHTSFQRMTYFRRLSLMEYFSFCFVGEKSFD